MSTLGDLTAPKIDQSGPPKSSEFTYIDISSIDNRLKRIVEPKRLSVRAAPSRAKQRLQPGDVLVSMTRPNLNAVAIISPDLEGSVGSTGFHVLRAVEGIESRWLFYAVQTHGFVVAMTSLVQGALYPAVRPKDIRAFGIEAPSLEEQRLIVAEIEKQFSRLDEAVANLKRVKANLKRYKASVLKAAVEGKLTENWRKQHPDVEPPSKLLERILAKRRAKWIGRGKYKEPAEMDTSARTFLPDGWLWASIEALSTKVVDGVHKKPNYVSRGVPFVTVRNLTAGPGINLVKLNFVTKEDHQQFIKRADPGEGDVLISKDGTLGVVRVIRTKAIFSIFVSVALVKPVLREMSDYLGVALSSPQVQVQMVPKGSGLQHIHLEDLRADCVPLPPLDEQKEIVSEVEHRLSVIDELEATIEADLTRADRLRQSTLARAFSGELITLQ